MKFTKMHGCGNDYVYVDCTEHMLADPSAAAIAVSDRHFGVGGDGLILICPSDKADFRMAMYNADGSEGSMCGNGIRCVAKFVYDKGLTDKTTLNIETKAGIKTLELTVEDGKVSLVKVNMGMPDFRAEAVPVVGLGRDVPGLGEGVIGQTVTVAGKPWTMTCLSMGNPHAVVWVDDVAALPLEQIGPAFEHAPYFPDRVNTEFVQVLNDHEINMRVWERGSGETLACGTGACAAVVAAVANGLCEKGRDITVRVQGGDLVVHYTDEAVTLTGDAKLVYTGVVEY